MRQFAEELQSVSGAQERSRLLLSYAKQLQPLPEADRRDANRVMGCTAQVWLSAHCDEQSGRMQFFGDSDSELTKGLCAVLVNSLSGLTPREVLEVRTSSCTITPPSCALHSHDVWHALCQMYVFLPVFMD